MEQAKEILNTLLNAIETITKENKELKQINQELRGEINRLKGEQGKPDIQANEANGENISSNTETKERKTWKKKGKKGIIKINRTVKCPVDRSTLPSDAQFKGTEKIVGLVFMNWIVWA